MRAIIAIGRTTLGEAIRRKVLLVILLVGVLFLSVAPGLGVLSARSETVVLRGMVLGIIQLTSALIAIVLTVYMLPNEIERRTIYTILCKPVQRWQFLIGKYLGAVLALGVMMLLMTTVMEITVAINQGIDANRMVELATGPLMFFIQMSLLAAVAMFFSTFVTPLVNFFLSAGMYLLGSLFATFFETLKDNPNTHPLPKAVALVVNTILPNFSNYNVQNHLINPDQTIQNPTAYYTFVTGYGLFYIGVLLVGAILIFDRREF
ncbi:MAG: ABC transporter permease [Fimbriimonas ginsengisoli]|uniref:ABC transporter permease n=1 Tax=Fimbriimonas ginsengisoli TaxID=1005039 RepID=A0A931LQQ5_FIMGI|nr:ABC transporter permease [Fimbriimonas ginsengisoli]